MSERQTKAGSQLKNLYTLVGSSKPLLLVYTVLHKGWINEQVHPTQLHLGQCDTGSVHSTQLHLGQCDTGSV